GKPFAYVFDKFDLINNNPNPRNFEYYAADFPGTAKVVPVTINGGSAFNYFVGYGANKATHVFGFKTPNSFATNAKLYESSETFGDPLGFQIDNPKWRAGFLYFCFNEQYVQGRYHVRFVRLPCKDVGGNLWTSLSASDGFFDHYFGLSGPGDAPGDQVSYLKPAIAVNKNLDCAIVYGRVGFKTAQPLYPEARFSLLYHNKSSQNPSTLIHKGNFNPGTPMEKRLDLVNAVVDPTDDQTLWFVHAFADQSLNDYRMVIGHVKP
ncbi:MAG TPA: hypothetical protein VKT78_06435, partial [Fimbriimonadaceae bacterium]|nr:hypothetical protein [Fimbriimonadaceae bacterium]